MAQNGANRVKLALRTSQDGGWGVLPPALARAAVDGWQLLNLAVTSAAIGREQEFGECC